MEFENLQIEINSIEGEVRQQLPSPSFELKQKINEIYKDVFGKTLPKCNCHDVYTDAYFKIKLYMKNNKTRRVSSLKNGVLLSFKGNYYNNTTLTDAISREYLKKFPNGKILFSKLPSKPTPREKNSAKVETRIEKIETKTDEIEIKD